MLIQSQVRSSSIISRLCDLDYMRDLNSWCDSKPPGDLRARYLVGWSDSLSIGAKTSRPQKSSSGICHDEAAAPRYTEVTPCTERIVQGWRWRKKGAGAVGRSAADGPIVGPVLAVNGGHSCLRGPGPLRPLSSQSSHEARLRHVTWSFLHQTRFLFGTGDAVGTLILPCSMHKSSRVSVLEAEPQSQRTSVT